VELGELAESIKQHGVIQPIVVRPVKGAQDRFEIIAGERRWRASQAAGLHEVPIVPVDVSDSDALELAIIENVQREDLNAMEEALGYHALADEFKRNQEDIARIVGKSRSHVANMMRLTKLPVEVQDYVSQGQLSAGHARALIGVPDPLAAAKRIVEEGLNVRQTEELAHVEGVPVRQPQKARAGKAKDADTVALEKQVSDALGLAVNISHRSPGGTVQISYRNLEQLDDITRRLTKNG
jgi:ParB family transcriptional regulator, chromosome partitioning protein